MEISIFFNFADIDVHIEWSGCHYFNVFEFKASGCGLVEVDSFQDFDVTSQDAAIVAAKEYIANNYNY